MKNLKTKLAFFNLLSKLGVTMLFLIFLPWLVERINLRQVDRDLIQKREKTIQIIGEVGIEPFISSDSVDAFGSFNILKEEFISIERTDTLPDLNYINVSDRIIENERITYRVLNYSIIIDGQKYLIEAGKSLESIMYARKNIMSIILLFLAITILITLFADLEYTSVVLKPLKKITGKLKGISTPSTFDRIPVKTTTSDFVNLDRALGDLMTQIDESFRKEKEITVNISHELLTPLAVIRSKLENILLTKGNDQATALKIEESLKTLYRLQSLVNSLLLIARIESNQYLMEEYFRVSEVLNDIVEELNPVATDRGVELINEDLPETLFGRANRSLIFSMFHNIINNAIKNTSSGGRVIITGELNNGRLKIRISDTGVGLSEAQISDLFLRFKARKGNDQNGTGIGLAITKSIADRHQIEISVLSGFEKGTEFSFLFPENS